LTVLNKFGPSGHGEAQVQYLDGDFRVISPGTYVRCAITDVRIPLDELKYWSVDLQEAYSVPTAVLQRHFPGALKTQGSDRFVARMSEATSGSVANGFPDFASLIRATVLSSRAP
jgi:hypothetical protein